MATETRRCRIQRKRFTRRDLCALAKLFASFANDPGDEPGDARLIFRLSTADDIVYESEDLGHFEEGRAIDLKNITRVSLEFTNYRAAKRVELELEHGGTYGSFRVSGPEEQWVHAVFSRLQDRLQSVEPSDCWFTRHPRLLFGAAAVTFIFAAALALMAILKFTPLRPLDPGSSFSGGALLALAIFGSFSGAEAVQKWICSGWPSIDLNVGPRSARVQLRRRTIVGNVMVWAVVPILLMVGYDGVKILLSHSTHAPGSPAAGVGKPTGSHSHRRGDSSAGL